jgi:hypothetical protein
VEARLRAVRDVEKEEATPPDGNAEPGASNELDEIELKEDEDEDDNANDDETGVEKRALYTRELIRFLGEQEGIPEGSKPRPRPEDSRRRLRPILKGSRPTRGPRPEGSRPIPKPKRIKVLIPRPRPEVST